MIQSSVWRVRDHYYDRKKKIQSSVWQVHDHYYDRKKKIQSSVWRVRDNYYDRLKRYSHQSLVAIVIFVLVQLELNHIQIH